MICLGGYKNYLVLNRQKCDIQPQKEVMKNDNIFKKLRKKRRMVENLLNKNLKRIELIKDMYMRINSGICLCSYLLLTIGGLVKDD